MSSPESDDHWSSWSSDGSHDGDGPLLLLQRPAYFVPRDAAPRDTGHTAAEVLDLVGRADLITMSLLQQQLVELWLRERGGGDPALHGVEVRDAFYSEMRAEPADGGVVHLHCSLSDEELAAIDQDHAPSGLWSLVQNLH